MLPSFTEISYFIEVAKVGNISRASERLGITQPSLSHAMQRLEGSLGSELFIRSRTGVKLTKSGSAFLTMAEQFITQWEQIKSSVQETDSTLSGHYSIGLHPSVALYSLKCFLPKLVEDYPQLQIELVHDLSRKILQQVISFKIDFAIVVNPSPHPELIIHQLCTDDVMIWSHQRLSQPLTTLLEERYPFICDPDLIQVQKILIELKKRGFAIDRFIKSSNLEVVRSLTAEGIGLGILPKRVALNEGFSLKPTDPSLPSYQDSICLVYRADTPKTKAHRTIVSAMKTLNQLGEIGSHLN